MGQLESYRTHRRLLGINKWKCITPCEKGLEIFTMANERHLVFFSFLKSALVQTEVQVIVLSSGLRGMVNDSLAEK